MIAPVLRLALIAAASATAGWLGSSFWRRRNSTTDGVDEAAQAQSGGERRIRTVVWCDTCHAHMPLEHSCDAAGVRKVAASGPATPLVGDFSIG